MATQSCPACAAETGAEALHCERCGASLARTCSSCGERVAALQVFCGRCGVRLPAGSATAVHDGERTAPAAAPLKKERRYVTILFADISASTEMIDGEDPEHAVDTLDPALLMMREIVRRFGGTVNEVRGDGVMALFGAPIAQEDHALRACHAAVELQRRIRELPGRPVRLHVGLNSGEVVVRTILNDLAFEYTAVGPAVHVAARLQAMAEPGRILLSARTHALVAGFVSVIPRGPVGLRGIAEPVEVFELDRSLGMRSRWDVRSKRGLSEFVGRADELEALARDLGWAAAGYRRLVTVSGPAGVGKSRLVHELIERARSEGWTVLEADGSALTQTATYYPVRKLFEGWIGIRGSQEASERAAWLDAKLEALGREVEDARAALEIVLELPPSDASFEKLEPGRRRDRVIAALGRLITHIAETAPLVLVFEDLQWIDEETRSLLEHLATDPSEAPVLIVATFRSDFTPSSEVGGAQTAVTLDGLHESGSEALLRSELGQHPGLAPVVSLLVEKSGGIPLFLEETLRHLIEGNALKGRAGDYRPAAALSHVVIPETIEAVIAARLDRLDWESKELLERCSVIGRELPLSLVAKVCEQDEGALRPRLDALCRLDFLRRPETSGREHYLFKHALTQDAVYQRLLREERRRLHLRALEALEEGDGESGDTPIEAMGYHAYRAEHWSKATEYLQQAGVKAVKRSAHREALSCFRDALDALGRLPRDEDRIRASVRLRLLIRGCLVPLGDAEQIEHQMAEAERDAAEVGDLRTLGLVYANASYSDWLAGRHAAGIESGKRAHAVARKLDDLTLFVGANFGLGLAYHGAGRFREAVETHEDLLAKIPEGLERSRFHGPAAPAVLAWAFLAYARAELGECEHAVRNANTALALARELDDVFGLVLSRIAAGHAFLRVQDVKRAVEVLEPGVGECQRAEMRTVAVGLVAHLGFAYAMQGEPDRAIDALVRVVEVADDEEIPQQNLDLRLLSLGWAHLVRGDLGEAVHFAAEAAESARRHGDDGTRGWALLLGAIARARRGTGVEDGPAALFEAALGVARERSLVPLRAHVHLERARWLAAVGTPDAAAASAGEAQQLFDALGLHALARGAEALAAGRSAG